MLLNNFKENSYVIFIN